MDVETGTHTRRLARVWAHRPSRALLLSRIVSDVGDFLGLAAILLYAFDQSGSLAGPGAAFAAQALPAVLIGLFGGRRLTSIHPGRGLVATHLVAAGTVALIATTPSLPLVLLAVAVLGAMRSASSALRMAAIASSVPDELRRPVIALSSTSYQTGQVIGFLGGAALVATVGPEVALLADVGTFLVAAVLLGGADLVHAPRTAEPTDPSTSLGSAVSALRIVFADRSLALLIPLAWLTMLTSALPETAAPGLVPRASVGLVMAAAPAATAVAATFQARRGRASDRTLTGQATLYGGTLAALAVAVHLHAPLPVLLAAIVAVGVGNTWIIGVQTRLAGLGDTGRVAEIYAVLTASMIALEGLGAIGLGLLAPRVGPALPFAGVASVLSLVAGIAWFRRRAPTPVAGPAEAPAVVTPTRAYSTVA